MRRIGSSESRALRWTYRSSGSSLPTVDRLQASSMAAASPALKSRASASCAGLGVGAEERLHVPLQPERQLRQGRPLAEPGQGEVDQQIFAPPPGDGLPGLGVRDPLDDREGPLQRAEPLDDRLRPANSSGPAAGPARR